MSVKLELQQDEVNLGETVRAKVTVRNDGATAVTLPRPEFCLPSVSLHVTRRPDAPGPESFLTRVRGEAEQVQLAPGETAEGVIEFPAVEPRPVFIEALYRPTGRVTPALLETNAERSKSVTLKVHGKRLLAKLDTEAGLITLEFFPDRALNHVTSFVALAQKGYFNGISFHRVVPDFVIQGGDPTGSGSGGPGDQLPAEFNDIRHVPGILSMARTSDPHSAGSQFFICTADCPNLDNQYTVFGRVSDGLDAVMEIGRSADHAGRFHMRKVEITAE
jgi:cyclophilin family peptidyl-prolyl cis-trans isomerase